MLEVKEPEEGVLAVTRLQNKKAKYLDPCTEKERLEEVKPNIERAMAEEQMALHPATNTPLWSGPEKTIIKQML